MRGKNRNKNQNVFLSVILIVLCILIGSVAYYYIDILKSTKGMKTLEDKMVFADQQENDLQNGNPILPEFVELYNENPHIVGWLKIEGTTLNYPVMKDKDDVEYYLDHGFDRKESKGGLPILDKKCTIEGPSTNLIIHGHNMKSGLLFGILLKYKNQSFYKEHPIIKFHSIYEKGQYEIVSVFLSKVYRKNDDVFKFYQFVQADTEEEFDTFARNIKRLALYDTNVEITHGDQLITLSTCEYSTENGRLVVVARKMD